MTLDDLKKLARSILRTDPRPEFMQHWQNNHKDRWIPPRHYYKFMYALASIYKLQVMVELGTDCGFGAWHLAEGNPDGIVIAVDKTLERVEKKPDNIIYIEGDTVDACSDVITKANGKLFDLIFFDSTHNSEHAMNEFLEYDPQCANGAIQLFDDAMESRDMRSFWGELPGPKLFLNELHPQWARRVPGFGVRIKP